MKLLAVRLPAPIEIVPSGRGLAWLAPVLAAVALLLVTSIVAVSIGKTAMPLDVQMQIVARRLLNLDLPITWAPAMETILLDVRFPRVALAALVGAGLAVAGTAYQGLFRNPLADPYLLGVAPGAGLGVVLAFVFPVAPWLRDIGAVQVMAFVGALAAASAVYVLARVGRATPVTTLLLAGVALGALLTAATAYLMYLHGDKLLVVYGWMLGGFNVASWEQVRLVGPGVLGSVAAVALCGRALDVLQLGEEQAATLGLNVELAKRVLVAAAALATACAVSAAGLIGFVGLIVPHVVRILFGPGHRRLVPLAALVGASFLIGADALARSLPGPAEVPVGVLTAACGAPFFLALLRQQKRAIF